MKFTEADCRELGEQLLGRNQQCRPLRRRHLLQFVQRVCLRERKTGDLAAAE